MRLLHRMPPSPAPRLISPGSKDPLEIVLVEWRRETRIAGLVTLGITMGAIVLLAIAIARCCQV
jgi:hypothetical protein